MLKVKRLSKFAILPKRATEGAATYDLYSAMEAVVPANGKMLIKTDISIEIPARTYARIAPRSGLALKHSIQVEARVIDSDYRGNIGVILFNHSNVDFNIRCGDRVAQMIFEKIVVPEVQEI